MIQNLATDNWITILFVFLLAILVILNFLFPIKFKAFLSFFKKEQFYVKYIKTFVVSDLFFLLFSFFSVLVYAFLLYKLVLYFNRSEQSNHFLFYLQIAAYTFWYVILRFILGRIVQFLFDIKSFQDSLLLYKWLYLSKSALLLFPFLVVFHYYNLNFYYVIIAVFFGIILVYNYFVLILKNQKYIFKHLFYFILYLCTLEIAPLIVYLKIIFKV